MPPVWSGTSLQHGHLETQCLEPRASSVGLSPPSPSSPRCPWTGCSALPHHISHSRPFWHGWRLLGTRLPAHAPAHMLRLHMPPAAGRAPGGDQAVTLRHPAFHHPWSRGKGLSFTCSLPSLPPGCPGMCFSNLPRHLLQRGGGGMCSLCPPGTSTSNPEPAPLPTPAAERALPKEPCAPAPCLAAARLLLHASSLHPCPAASAPKAPQSTQSPTWHREKVQVWRVWGEKKDNGKGWKAGVKLDGRAEE